MTTEYQRTEIIEKIADALTNTIAQTSAGVGESRRLALVVVRAVSRRYPGVSDETLYCLVVTANTNPFLFFISYWNPILASSSHQLWDVCETAISPSSLLLNVLCCTCYDCSRASILYK